METNSAALFGMFSIISCTRGLISWIWIWYLRNGQKCTNAMYVNIKQSIRNPKLHKPAIKGKKKR